MAAGLEVDYPATPLRVDEATVDDHTGRCAVFDHRQAEFGLDLGVVGGEQPAPARAVQGGLHRAGDFHAGGLEFVARHTQCAQLSACKAVPQRRPRTARAVDCQILQEAMRHRADVLGGSAGPIELQRHVAD